MYYKIIIACQSSNKFYEVSSELMLQYHHDCVGLCGNKPEAGWRISQQDRKDEARDRSQWMAFAEEAKSHPGMRHCDDDDQVKWFWSQKGVGHRRYSLFKRISLVGSLKKAWKSYFLSFVHKTIDIVQRKYEKKKMGKS